MTLKDLHESWVKTGYPSRTEIQKAIEGLLAGESNTKDCPYSDDGKCYAPSHPSSNKGNDKGLVKELEDLTACKIGYLTYTELREILAKFRGGK